jgi:hypothetical protein
MILIYVDEISERLIYTLNFIFHERGLVYSLTNDWKYFFESPDSKFIYSEKYDDSYLMIRPSTLLFDEKIKKYEIEKSFFNAIECLAFDHVSDPFASIFYILARFEEYTIKLKDEHDRFQAKESILFQYSWLNFAICDRWAVEIINFINKELKINLIIEIEKVKIIPTFDIDNTYAFQWKSGIRKWLGYLKDKLRNDKIRLSARKDFYKGKITDPYDTFAYIKEILYRNFDVKIFWLLGDYAKYDRNIFVSDVRHQRLIKSLSKEFEIGLHPSYESNKNPIKLATELNHLERIIGKKIQFSRQHFLKVQIPKTYQYLQELGFKHDYSLGYAEEIGFRAGTAHSFNFFDLMKNIETDYVIHPFVYMDGTLNEYKKWTTIQAKEKIEALYDEVKKYGGDFIFIWHNSTIGNFGKWKGWKDVLEFTLNLEKNEI